MSLSRSITDILDQVRKTATVRSDEGRLLPASDASERLKAIATEIGETLLPRSLCFQMGQNSQLIVDAGSRRLLKVLELQPDICLREGDALFSGREDSKRDEQLASLAHMLILFVHQDGELKVFSTPPQELYGADEVGYTSDEIEKACTKLDIAPEEIEQLMSQAAAPIGEPIAEERSTEADQGLPADIPENITTFYKAICEFAHSCLLVSPPKQLVDHRQNTNGVSIDAIINEISAMLEQWLSDTADTLSGQRMIIMRSQAADGSSVAFFMDAGFSIVVHFKNTDLVQAVSAWNDVNNQ